MMKVHDSDEIFWKYFLAF